MAAKPRVPNIQKSKPVRGPTAGPPAKIIQTPIKTVPVPKRKKR